MKPHGPTSPTAENFQSKFLWQCSVRLHERWVALLDSLSEDDFQKGYNHPESGRQNLAKVLALYAWHSRHHTAHITNLRSRRGW